MQAVFAALDRLTRAVHMHPHGEPVTAAALAAAVEPAVADLEAVAAAQPGVNALFHSGPVTELLFMRRTETLSDMDARAAAAFPFHPDDDVDALDALAVRVLDALLRLCAPAKPGPDDHLLVWAADGGLPRLAARMLAEGCDVNFPALPHERRLPLHAARTPDMARFLVAAGATVDAAAVLRSSPHTAITLCAAGILDVNAPVSTGDPVHFPAGAGADARAAVPLLAALFRCLLDIAHNVGPHVVDDWVRRRCAGKLLLHATEATAVACLRPLSAPPTSARSARGTVAVARTARAAAQRVARWAAWLRRRHAVVGRGQASPL